LHEEILDADPESLRTLPDFERGEGVDVDTRGCRLHGAADIEIGGAGIFGMDAALHADFAGAAGPGLAGAAGDLLEVERVGAAAQILAQLALREGAELAAEIADIGVVDVARHHVG